jgi:hypothetical protein
MDFSHTYLLVVTALAIYMVGISLMTTQVSYPLYASVPRPAFVDYHARYQRRIQPVIIGPGFPTFLACVAFAFLRPAAAPGWLAVLVAAGGLIALAVTVGAAIPSHLRLQRGGFDAGPYRTLRIADAVRTSACALSAGALIACVLAAFDPTAL